MAMGGFQMGQMGGGYPPMGGMQGMGAPPPQIDTVAQQMLLIALRADRAGEVQQALQRGANPSLGDSCGFTALHWAARFGRSALAEMFLAGGCDVNQGNGIGDTPLHIAASEGHSATMMALLKGGANPNAQNQAGNSPLHYACYWGHGAMAAALIQRGANGELQNSAGETPLSKAAPPVASLIQSLTGQAGVMGQALEQQAVLSPQQRAAMSQMSPQQRQQFLQQVGSQQQAQRVNAFQQQQVASQGPSSQGGSLGSGQQHSGMQQHYSPQQGSPPMQPMQQPVLSGGGGDPVMPDPGFKVNFNPHAMPERPDEEDEEDFDVPEWDPNEMKEWECHPSEISTSRLLGKGAFGEVHEGVWRGTDVAVKRLNVQDVGKRALFEFRSEVDVMSKLRHPNVVLFMAACVTPPDMCIVTEYLERGSLYGVLHNEKVKLSWDMMLKMATDTAKGMNYLHMQKPVMMHRDLKSLNLLVDENWVVKVADFGLTAVKSKAYKNTQCGTPQWMAPEVLRNEEYDERADVFSYGVVLWELYTRKEPYAGMNPMQVGMKVLLENMRPDVPKDCPPLFASLMRECWDVNPAKRPNFKQILEKLRYIKSRVAPPPGFGRQRRR